MSDYTEEAERCVIREAVAADAPAIEGLYRELVSDALICVRPEHPAGVVLCVSPRNISGDKDTQAWMERRFSGT